MERGSIQERLLMQHFEHARAERILTAQLIAAAAFKAEAAGDIYDKYLRHMLPDYETRKEIQERIAAKQLKSYKAKAFQIKLDEDGHLSAEVIDCA